VKDTIAFFVMVGLTAVALAGVPFESWRADSVDPCHIAGIAGGVTIVLLLVGRLRDAIAFERSVFAVFLLGMPLIYISSWLWVTPHDDVKWLVAELAGFPIYAALAIAGVRWSPWFLVVGIAGHGIGWDLWHHAHATYIPHWYATGCFLMDVGVAIYAAARIPRWREVVARRRAGVVEVAAT
jgi:hypothetical protein